MSVATSAITTISKKETLCSTESFIRYSAKQGIQIVDEDLRQLQNLGLLHPIATKNGENCYNKYQHIILKIIYQQKHWKSDLHDDLSASDIALLKEKIGHFYSMLQFFLDAQELDKKWMQAMRKKFKHDKEEIGEDDAVFEWPLVFNGIFLQRMRDSAASLLREHNLEIANIEGWRFQLSELCHLKRNQSLERYLRFVPPDFLINAEETNKMICILNRYLWLLTDQRRTVKQVLLGMAERPCDICCAPIKNRLNKVEQHTCGRKECIAKRDAIQKQKKRALQKVASKRRV